MATDIRPIKIQMGGAMTKRAPQTGKTRYRDEVRHRNEIMRDGAAYFYDGRFAHHAELIGLDPTLRPQWENET
jgi:hypothetical protein